MSTDPGRVTIAPGPFTVDSGVTIEYRGPRRRLILAGPGLWIVTDRERISEDELADTRRQAEEWRGEGAVPRLLYIDECEPLIPAVRLPSGEELEAAIARAFPERWQIDSAISHGQLGEKIAAALEELS